jgi:Prealbumin-like fold domain
MTERRKGSRRRRPILWATLAAFAAGLVFTFAASTAPLPGSNFEIDDGNLIVNNPAPAIDWASVSEQRKADKPSGSTDDSFGQGTKEDTPVPTIVDGSIPPNKSDLLNMGFYLEENANGRFLNLFWHRVQEPQGTTNMDFEFNKSSTLSANGVTPVRTAGDVLIQYDLSQGGTNPQLFASRWVASGAGSQCEASNSTPCWGTRVNLTAAGVATGSINTSPIPVAQSDGLAIDIDGDGTLDPISTRTFGEAQVDLNALTGGGSPACVVFGSAYLKSRSSDSFTAALKDFIAPLNLNLDNCGNVIIRKVTIPASDPATVQFGYTKSFPTDPATANTFTLGHGQSKNYGDDVIPGTGYTVVEDVIPANWAFTSIDCSASSGVTPTIVGAQVTFNIDDTNDVLDCTYTNTQLKGAIKVTKTRKHAADGTGDHPHAGVNFTVNGVTKATDANGVACFDGLNFGAYTVHEVVPAGYHGEADKQVTVDNNATCAATPYAGESVSFHNTPLTNITVTVDSQVAGGTSSTIDCDPVTPGSDAGPGDDISHSLNDREPGTYTCTVVVDP